MAPKIQALVIQEFLNDLKARKSSYIEKGIIVFPDVFSGDFKNDTFEHRQYKKMISDKIKEVYAGEWVTVDSGIIKKDRLEAFFLKNGLPSFEGYENSPFIPIARIHKNSRTDARKSLIPDERENLQSLIEKKDDIFDKDYFEAKMHTLFYQIVEMVNKAVEEKGRTNSKITLPGVSEEIVYDTKKYREFVKSLAPFIERLEIALGFVSRKDIIGNIDYYIKRDSGGILKIDALKSHSHDIFNLIYKERFSKLQKDSPDFEARHNSIKTAIKEKRDIFLKNQKAFFAKVEARVLEDDFFMARGKSDNRYENIYIDSDMEAAFEEFPELKKEFFDTFTKKIEMILSSNNVTKKDATLIYEYVEKNEDNPDEQPHISIEFKNIENFRITRGLKKYNGIAANIPMDEEEQKIFDSMLERKEELMSTIDGFYEEKKLKNLYQVNEELKKIKKEFPLIPVDLNYIEAKIDELEHLKKKEEDERREYENAILNIESILNDKKRLEDEIFNLDVGGTPKGLRSAERQMQVSKLGFLEKLAKIITDSSKMSLETIPSYNDFDFSKISTVIFDILYNTFIENSLEDVAPSKKVLLKENLLKNEELKKELLGVSKEYSSGNSNVFVNAFADSFFNITAKAKNTKEIPKIIGEMIEGTAKYKPIFETNTGHVTHRPDQVMMRVKEAMKLKQVKLDNWDEKVHALDVKLVKANSDNKAYLEARSMNAIKIKNFTASKVADIVFNKDGKYSNEKRMFLWLDIASINKISTVLQKAKEEKKLEHRKSSLDAAIKFFESLKRTNTKEQLEAKVASHKNQLAKYERSMESAHDNYDKEEKRGLYEFDIDLRRMKEAFVKNFCKSRKE